MVERETIHGPQKGEQFRFCKLVGMVSDQHASRRQVHPDGFDFGHAAQQVAPKVSPLPLRMADLLERWDAQSQSSGQSMDDPRGQKPTPQLADEEFGVHSPLRTGGNVDR
jgi:hypothetical protein